MRARECSASTQCDTEGSQRKAKNSRTPGGGRTPQRAGRQAEVRRIRYRSELFESGGRCSKRGALELTPSQEFITKKDAPTINSEQITHEKNLA